MIACILLRNQIISLLECIHLTILKDACFREGSGEAPIARFGEILRESLRWDKHARDWCLHGTRTGGEPPSPQHMVHRDNVSYTEVLAYAGALGQAYSWCLVPWGVNGTGLMIGLIAFDDVVFTRVMAYLGVIGHNLLVSRYTGEQLTQKRFRGAIFRCPEESSARALWRHGRGSSDSVLVLSVEGEDSPSSTSSDLGIIAEARGHQQGVPIRRKWLQVFDEALLVRCLSDHATIITGNGLDEKAIWLALQDFAGVADHVSKDPLSFGLKALESTSWIFVPRHDDERWEIYINRDPQVTEHLLTSDILTRLPYFTHRSFC